IAGASEQTYTLVKADVGTTIRVQETASNEAGAGAPAVSAPSPIVSSNQPGITNLTPSSGITGATVLISGTALSGTTKVTLGKLQAPFTVLSPTQIEATVPDGAVAGKVTVTTPVGSATSSIKFNVTFSVTGFSPKLGAPGRAVTIKGRGFTPSST